MIDQYLKDCEERANLPVSMGYGLTNYNRDVTKLTKMLRKAVDALDELAGVEVESTGIVGWHMNGDVLHWGGMDISTPSQALAELNEMAGEEKEKDGK